MAQCQYKHGEYQCPRDAESGKHCILHDEDIEGKKDRIADLVRNILAEREDVVDFTGAQFPELGQSFNGSVGKSGIFDYAVFHGDVDFSKMEFRKGWSFNSAEFKGEVRFSGLADTGRNMSFTNTRFRKDVDFDKVTFTGQAIFKDTEFHGKTAFDGASFNTIVAFYSVKFLGETTFTGSNLPERAEVFQKCDFRGVRILTIQEFPDSRNLDSVVWPRWPSFKQKWLKFLNRGRRLIYDENTDTGRREILRVYRRLHKYYYDRSHFDLASDFYVGFMVMKRRTERTKSIFSIPWLLDRFFSLFAKYGESTWRPFFSILAILFMIPFGIKAKEGIVNNPISYWDAFWINIMTSTRYQNIASYDLCNEWSERIIFAETILNAILLGLFALCVRRHFVPKKPLDEKT